MPRIKIALLGFGTVGNGVYQTIQTYQQRLQSLLGKEVEIAGVLIKDENKDRNIGKSTIVSSDIDQILAIPGLEVVIEAIVGVEPGYTYLSKAIENGLHVITANKQLLAHHGTELRKKALEYNVQLEYEATVAGGVPVVGTLRHLLQVNRVVKVDAILNGTSNFILSDIRENHSSFTDSLRDAQREGYAEADPSNDIDGWDAFYKLMIVNDLLLNQQPTWDQVVHSGIRDIELADIMLAESAGFRIKHVASFENNDGDVKAAVEPIVVTQDHPLYTVEGVENAIVLTGDLVGELKLQGPGAGALPTASALVEDFISIYHKNDLVQRSEQVNFVPATGSTEQQDWLIIGAANSNSYDFLTIHDKWSLATTGDNVEGYHVSGKESAIRRLLKEVPELKGFRIEGYQKNSTKLQTTTV